MSRAAIIPKSRIHSNALQFSRPLVMVCDLRLFLCRLQCINKFQCCAKSYMAGLRWTDTANGRNVLSVHNGFSNYSYLVMIRKHCTLNHNSLDGMRLELKPTMLTSTDHTNRFTHGSTLPYGPLSTRYDQRMYGLIFVLSYPMSEKMTVLRQCIAIRSNIEGVRPQHPRQFIIVFSTSSV